MDRRTFLGCGAAAAGLAGALEALSATAQPLAAPSVQLWTEERGPLRASDLVPHRSYLFLYPYESTPCFLLDLDRPLPGAALAGPGSAGYEWPGGVGASRSIVAYSAICPHAFTHPTRQVAMIHYYGGPATVARRGNVISCCVHGSTFDPAAGAVPLQPPAEMPLAAIRLRWDPASDALHAEGLLGQPVFAEFFRSFPRSGRREVQGTSAVWPLERYSGAVLNC